MAKVKLTANTALYPVPVVLVSCCDEPDKKTNIITIAWCGIVCSNPPLISISIRPSRHSHEIIKRSGNFVVNIPTEEILEKVDFCGNHSGSGIDKFQKCSFGKLPSSKISSPMIKECPVNIECSLRQVIELGAHNMFIGEVLAVHVDNELLDKEKNIDYKKAMPVVFNQGEYWSLGKKIGQYGFSVK